MRAPAEAARPFRLVAVIDQEFQHPLALERRQFIDLGGEVGVDVNNFLAGDRMLCDHRMDRHRGSGTEHALAVVGGGQA